MDGDRYWRRLRALRVNPPGLAGTNKHRRDVFNAALEQAEQLTRSAAGLGPETRPINLFYGISQGTRAIAAAMQTDDAKFWLSNHGIDHKGSLDRSIRNIEVVETDKGNGAFTSLAALLGSPGLPEAVTLGQLIAAMPVHLPTSSWSILPRAIIVEHAPLSMTVEN